MKIINKRTIYFVDDEEAIRNVAFDTLTSVGYETKCFKDGIECLDILGSENCNLLITDVKMPGMDGLTLLKQTSQQTPWVPVLVITGYGDVAMAVQAMKLGAIDFIEKPLNRETFLDKIKEIFDKSSGNKFYPGDKLTSAESNILQMILQGYSNKEIANTLNRSIRTIEMHRSHIMQKFGANNIVDLIKKASKLSFENNFS